MREVRVDSVKKASAMSDLAASNSVTSPRLTDSKLDRNFLRVVKKSPLLAVSGGGDTGSLLKYRMFIVMGGGNLDLRDDDDDSLLDEDNSNPSGKKGTEEDDEVDSFVSQHLAYLCPISNNS